jgi:hypothetical protein
MSSPLHEGQTNSAALTQEAFDQQAPDLGLRLEAPTERSRDIGAVFALFRVIVDVGKPIAPLVPGDDDRAKITEIIRKWEELDPDRIVKRWQDFATDPFIGIGRGQVGELNQGSFDEWRESDELKMDMEAYPPDSPRRIAIREDRLTFVGSVNAVATYRIEETYTNRKMRATNAALILAKSPDGGWKIVAGTMHDKK